jgi:hypothetical protein
MPQYLTPVNTRYSLIAARFCILLKYIGNLDTRKNKKPTQHHAQPPAFVYSQFYSSLLVLGDDFLDVLNDAGVSEGRQITELITLAGDDLSKNPAHDLATAGLG